MFVGDLPSFLRTTPTKERVCLTNRVVRTRTLRGHAYARLRQINVRGEPRQLQLARPSTRLVAVWPSPLLTNLVFL